jgi:hypothetical protein
MRRRSLLWLASIGCGREALSLIPPPGDYTSHVLAIEAAPTPPIYLALEAPFAEALELDPDADVTFEAAVYDASLAAIDLRAGRLEHDPAGNPLVPPDQAFRTPLTPFAWAPIEELGTLASLRVRGSCSVTVARTYAFDGDAIDDGPATFVFSYENALLVGRANGAIFRITDDFASSKLELQPPDLETFAIVEPIPFSKNLFLTGRRVFTATITETTAIGTALTDPPSRAPVRWILADGLNGFVGLAEDGSIWRFAYPAWRRIAAPNDGPPPPCGGAGTYARSPAFIRERGPTLTVADDDTIRSRTFESASSGFCSMASLTSSVLVGSDTGELLEIDDNRVETLSASPIGEPIVAVVPVDRTIVLVTGGGLVAEHRLDALNLCPARKLIAGEGPYVAARYGARQVMVAASGILTLLDVRE